MTKEEVNKLIMQACERTWNEKTCKEIFKALSQEPTEKPMTVDVFDKIRTEIDRQEKWLLQAGYTAYNVDIAFDSIKSVLAESELLQMAVMNGKLRKEHK